MLWRMINAINFQTIDIFNNSLTCNQIFKSNLSPPTHPRFSTLVALLGSLAMGTSLSGFSRMLHCLSTFC